MYHAVVWAWVAECDGDCCGGGGGYGGVSEVVDGGEGRVAVKFIWPSCVIEAGKQPQHGMNARKSALFLFAIGMDDVLIAFYRSGFSPSGPSSASWWRGVR